MSIEVKKHNIYLDNAASTPINPRVKSVMSKFANFYGNPSSFNDVGRIAAKNLNESRLVVARFLGAHSEEVVFTSSGSEANNLAILGLANNSIKPAEIITTPIEHPSVLEPIRYLERKGWKITYLKVNKEGTVDLADVERGLNHRVVLVSIMYANNEIGTIQPISKISKIIRNFRTKSYPFFHVDACQATEYLGMNVNNLGVDLLTFNGTKIYGPKGIGVLYVKRGINLTSQIMGGGQENGLRAGTENLPAIAGLAEATSLINKKEGFRLSELRDYFINKIKNIFPDVKINGSLGINRLPNNINISFKKVSNEALLLELDKYGINAGSGSACTSRSVEPSHVLKAVGVGSHYINGAIRFSLGRQTTKKDMDYVLRILPKAVLDIRTRYKR